MTVRYWPVAMSPARQDLRLTTVVVLAVVAMMALMVGAVGNNAVRLNGYSAVLYCAVICIGTQWLAWIPASTAKTNASTTYGRPHLHRRRGVQFVGRISVRCAEFARTDRQFPRCRLGVAPVQLSVFSDSANRKRRAF